MSNSLHKSSISKLLYFLLTLLLESCINPNKAQNLLLVGDSIPFVTVSSGNQFKYNSIDKEQLQRFDKRKKNYLIPELRIPVHLETEDGTVLVAFELQRKDKALKGTNVVVMRKGRGQNKFKEVLRYSGGYPSFLYDKKNQKIYLFNGFAFYCSDNYGKSWNYTNDLIIDYSALGDSIRWTSFVNSPNNGIQLQNGVLAVPFLLSQYDAKGLKANVNALLCSDNSGKSWFFSPTTPYSVIANETTIAEYEDNKIMINARGSTEISWTKYNPGRRVFVSELNQDTLHGWKITKWKTDISDCAIKEPVCNASFIKMKYNGQNIGLFCNPQSKDGKRKNLTLMISSDFHNWIPFAVLTPLGVETFGYNSLCYHNGHLTFVYEDKEDGILYTDISHLIPEIIKQLNFKY